MQQQFFIMLNKFSVKLFKIQLELKNDVNGFPLIGVHQPSGMRCDGSHVNDYCCKVLNETRN